MSESYPSSGWSTRVRQRVRYVLAERDIRATALARRLGWSQSYMARRLTPTNALPFTVADLEAIAQELGIAPSDLIPSEVPA